MVVKSYEKELMEYGEYRLHKALLLYVPPILIFLGTFGNVFAFIVLIQKSMRRHSTYIYLAVLSVADLSVLYVGLFRLWIGQLTGTDIRDLNDWSCKFISMFGYTTSDYSVWLIIAVTIERYIVVCHPLRASSMCTPRRAVIVVLCTFFCLCLVNFHFFWTVQIVYFEHEGEYIPQCAGGIHYQVLMDEVWPWVDAFIYSFVPFAIISVLNIFIICEILRAKKARNDLQSNCFESRRHSTDSSRLTLMLLTISFAFLVTTLPTNISMITISSFTDIHDLAQMSKYRLIRTVTELLMYLNHSINFYLYCATGNRFRQQLFHIMCRRANVTPDQDNTELLKSFWKPGTSVIQVIDSDASALMRVREVPSVTL